MLSFCVQSFDFWSCTRRLAIQTKRERPYNALKCRFQANSLGKPVTKLGDGDYDEGNDAMHSIKPNPFRRRRRDALPRRVDEPRDRVSDGRGRVERRRRPQVDDPPRVVLEPYLEEGC